MANQYFVRYKVFHDHRVPKGPWTPTRIHAFKRAVLEGIVPALISVGARVDHHFTYSRGVECVYISTWWNNHEEFKSGDFMFTLVSAGHGYPVSKLYEKELSS